MNKPLMFLLFAFSAALAPTAAAVSTQTEEIGVNASEVSQLIRVSASLSFENLVPGHLYSTPVTVEWALPQQALANIAEGKVVVRVKIEPRVQDSWIHFHQQGANARVAYADLHCFVENGECSGQSSLKQTFVARYSAPFGATYPHEDGLRVSASLIPFQQALAEEEFAQDASEKIASLEEKSLQAIGIGVSGELRKIVADARALLAEKKFEEVTAKISVLEKRIAELEKPTLVETTPAPLEIEETKTVESEAAENAVEENAVQLGEREEESSEAAARENASVATGFALTSSTALAAAVVALAMFALLGYAAGHKGNNSPRAKKGVWEEERSMGSGEAADESKPGEYAPYSRETTTHSADPMDKWEG